MAQDALQPVSSASPTPTNAILTGIKGTVPPCVSAKDLCDQDPKEIQFFVKDMLTEGLNILAGPPKCGKSTLAFQLGVNVSSGTPLFDKLPCKKSGVLLISFEESKNKFHQRVRGLGKSLAACDFRCTESWPPLGEDGRGLEVLDDFLTENPTIKFVIVDTYSRFIRGSKTTGTYQAEYERVSKLKEIADKQSACFLFLHHTVKQVQDDWLASLYGTQALAGVADTVQFIQRERGSIYANLKVTGRDLEDQSFGLRYDKTHALWTYAGSSEILLLTPQQREIYFVLDEARGPIDLKDIAEDVYKGKSAVHNILLRLIDLGFVRKVAHGKYESISQGDKHTALSDENVKKSDFIKENRINTDN